MLEKLTSFFILRKDAKKSLSDTLPTLPGFFVPATYPKLIISPQRKHYLKQLWENSPLPADMYQLFYLQPLYQLLERVQNIPAALEGRWSQTGHFGDLTLQFTTSVVRLAKGHLFPPDTSPEDQAAQSLIWQAVIFWSALFYHLPLLASIKGELSNGKNWQPGVVMPATAFRFRFRTASPQSSEASALSALIAGQLLPVAAPGWLMKYPEALNNIAGVCRNQRPVISLIQTILNQAAGMLESPGSVISSTSITPPTNSSDLVLPQSTAINTPVANTQENKFVTWLSSGLLSSEIEINQSSSRIHIISGFIFLCTPDIFFLFIKQSKNNDDRKTIQYSFERLGIHHIVSGKKFFRAQLYDPEDKNRTFRSINGYLVKSAYFYKNCPPPADNPFIVLS